MKNITLSAEASLIDQAREKASNENSSLNHLFRQWLEDYVDRERIVREYKEFMESVSHVKTGGPYTRDEMNERR
ncbi:MAG: hypothetical protein HQL52_20055 [Magnetococcales bacterium]|nr:hypothetical protein [Magnetococcales bacterium]